MSIFKLLKNVVSKLFKTKKKEISSLENKKIKEKYEKYEKFLLLKNKKIPIAEIPSIIGLSKSEFYRISKKLKVCTWETMEIKTTRPKNVKQSRFKQNVKDKILEIRQDNLTYGKEKIATILARDFPAIGVISTSSVGRILTDFRAQNLIQRSISYYKLKKKRDFKDHAQRWTYDGCRPKKCGEFVQVDHMTVLKNNMYFKHFTAICPTSKMLFSKVFSNATSFSANLFLQDAIDYFPFKIKSIQVDGGSEFMSYFEEGCKNSETPLYVLPPASPKYNGNVERSNRTFREEFYARTDVDAKTVFEMNKQLLLAVKKYNEFRPHCSLTFKTPLSYYKDSLRYNYSQMS